MHRITPRPARKLACAAVAVSALLVGGCTSDSGDDKESAAPSSSKKSVAPAKYKTLPDPCKTVSEDTVEEVVEGVEKKKGKNLASTDTDSYGSCLWSGGHGENDANYRALTVSLKRYDSDASLGTGDEQAKRFFGQQVKATMSDEAHKDPEETALEGVGRQATSVGYTTEKKKQEYRVGRVIALHHNVVITVDYEGTGFEGADLPGADDVKKNAEKVAKEAVAGIE